MVNSQWQLDLNWKTVLMRHIRIANTKILCFKKSNLLADVKLSLKPNMTSWATRMYKMAFESSCWASKAFQIKSETEYVNSGATCIRIKFFGSEINYILLEPFESRVYSVRMRHLNQVTEVPKVFESIFGLFSRWDIFESQILFKKPNLYSQMQFANTCGVYSNELNFPS